MKQKVSHTERQYLTSRESERGAALVIALLVMLVLSLLGSGLLSVSFTETQVAFNDRRMIQALFNAEAALEEAKLRLSPTFTGAKITPVKSADWRAYIYTPAHATDYQTFDPEYKTTNNNNPVQSVQNAIEWGVARVKVKDAAVAGPPSLLVTAWGADGPIRRQVELELEPIVGATHRSVAHGKKDVKVDVKAGGRACTDSYDSRLPRNDLTNRGKLGHVSTENTAAGSLVVKGDATVKGDFQVYTTETVDPNVLTHVDPAQHEPYSTGQWETQKKDPSGLPSIPRGEIPPGAIPLNSDKGKNDLKLSGNSIRVVPEGVYWVNKLEISGNAKLITTGNVSIYVKEKVSVSGNGQMFPENFQPGNLTLIVGLDKPDDDDNDDFSDLGYEGGKVQLRGHGELLAVVYVPDGKVHISDGNFYGAIYAKGVKISGGCAHYDVNLGTGQTVTGYNRKAWRELIN